MVLIIDNYDSFTYNLYQMAGECGAELEVVKNDQYTVEQIVRMQPNHIILSPGPGRPEQAGICEGVVEQMHERVPILGVCLGHQAICRVFGGEITYAKTLIHGKRSTVHIANGSPVFQGLPPMLEAGRYHSLSVRRDTLPDSLLVIAEDGDGEVMGVKHRDFEVYGLQFHPESILTRGGKQILSNFLGIGGEPQ